MTNSDKNEWQSMFVFRRAKLVVVPELGYRVLGERDVAFNTVVLEIQVPMRQGSVPALVEVEAWGQVAKAISMRQVGDICNVRGIVSGKPWVDRNGQQRYITRLRVMEVVPLTLAPDLLEEVGF